MDSFFLHRHRHRHILAYLILLLASHTHGLTNPNSISQNLNRAEELRLSDPKQSLALGKHALILSQNNKDVYLESKALILLGLIEQKNKNFVIGRDYFEKAIPLLKKTKQINALGKVLMNIGDTYRFSNQIDLAISYVNQAIEIGIKLKDLELLSDSYNILGNIIGKTKNYTGALKNYSISLAYAIKYKHTPQLLRAHTNVAKTNKRLKNYQKAIEHYLSAINYSLQSQDYTQQVNLYSSIARAYEKINDIDSATVYKQKVLQTIELYGDASDRIQGYRALAQSYFEEENNEKSLELNQKALVIAEENGNQEDIAALLEHIASDQRKLGRYTEALANATHALDVQRELGNTQRIAKLLLNISIIYRRLSSYDNALEYAIELTALHESTGNMTGMAGAYNTTGLIYLRLERLEDARRYYEQTLALASNRVDTNKRADALRALSEIFQKTERYNEALWYAQEASMLYEQTDSLSGAEAANRTIGNIYRELSEDDKALKAYTLSLNQARKLKNSWSEGATLLKIGLLNLNTNIEKALAYAQEGLSIGTQLSAKALQLESYQLLIAIEESRGNHKKANDYTKKQYKLVKEIGKEDITQRLAELRIIGEAETRAREIENLKREVQINNLELSGASAKFEILNSRNIIASLELERERNTQLMLIGLTLFVFLALFYIYCRYRNSYQKQRILNEKNILIESKNNILEEQGATKDRYFSIIAHDLRDPISSLVSLSEMLLDNYTHYTPKQVHESIQAIHRSSSQTYNLLDELLEWAIQQLRNTDPIPRKHSIKDLCHCAIEHASQIANIKNIELCNDVPDDLYIYADRNMIDTVIRNLLTNAIKFTPRMGRVCIFAQERNQNIHIHIKDNGVGIPKQDIDNLFNIDKLTSRQGTEGEKGTGFGLILCKDLLQKNSGTIYAKNNVSQGSKFTFSLPNEKYC